MKNLIYILIVCASGMLAAQTEERTFSSKQEYVEYAYSNTNLTTFSSGYLLNLDYQWMDEEFNFNSYLSELRNPDKANGDKLIQMLHIMEKSDVDQTLKKTDITSPIYADFYRVTPNANMDIPLLIFDMDFERLKLDKERIVKDWSSDKPYPMFTENDAYMVNVQMAGPFITNLINPNVRFYWNNDYFLTNTEKGIKRVELTINGRTYSLFENETFRLFDHIDQELRELKIKIIYDDATTFSNTFHLNILKTNPLEGKAEKFEFDISGTIDGLKYDPELQYRIKYACGRNKLVKPFIVVAGWGPYTDNQHFNNLNIFKAKWPANFDDLYTDFNNFGLIETMRNNGYDIVICKFFPPNEHAERNANVLINLIEYINYLKNSNGSYEENVILSYSAGAIATRLALLKMEYSHLHENNIHHQTKLFISFDGEHQGANIPLAAQHMVKHMYNNSDWPNLGLYLDGLNQILEAPLTQELLHYYYKETGDVAFNETPNQGPSTFRNQLMNTFNTYNHIKNTHIPGYPSFTRNISIAQGANKGNYNNTNQQYPYPHIEGLIPFQKTYMDNKTSSQFNLQGGNEVFAWKEKISKGNWLALNQFVTNSECLVLDNAPGGTVTVNDNPLDAIVMLMTLSFPLGTPDEKKKYTQFCFTPTIFCHDIQNFDPNSSNHRMDYSMADNKLMFKSLQDYNSGNSNEFYGYPHLPYPNNHYNQVTPFDAVFSSNINEEHILCNKVERYDYLNYDEPFVRAGNSFIHPLLDFCLYEVDHENAYIQNENYGGFCRNNYTYQATIHAPKKVYIGEKVTDRTDFKKAFFQANSRINVKAGEEIIIKVGTDILAGTNSHFKIENVECIRSKSSYSTNTQNPNSENSSQRNTFDSKEDKWVNIYPNPSNGTVFLNFLEEFNIGYSYAVYSLSGQLITQGNILENKQELQLTKGVYIIKINNHEKFSTQRIIVL